LGECVLGGRAGMRCEGEYKCSLCGDGDAQRGECAGKGKDDRGPVSGCCEDCAWCHRVGAAKCDLFVSERERVSDVITEAVEWGTGATRDSGAGSVEKEESDSDCER